MSTYSLAGNAVYLSLYTLLFPPQIYFGIRHKTWGFLFGMTCGLILEMVAYVGRIQLGQGEDKFLQYLVAITIGPAFFSAAVYLCLARIVTVYGTHLSLLKPRTYTIGFMVADFLALILQASGGAIVGGDDISKFDMGLSIVQAGLSFHLISIVAFVGLAGWFAWGVYKRQTEWDPEFANLQNSRKFRWFLISLAVATLCIFIRTSYRVAELSEGFDSKLARNEPAFMVLEGGMILVAVACLTTFHPGVAFQGRWMEADFQLKSRQRDVEDGNSSHNARGAGKRRHIPLDSM